MNRCWPWLCALILLPLPVLAGEEPAPAPPLPETCDLAAVAALTGVVREGADEAPVFRVSLRLHSIVLGCVLEGRTVSVTVPAPLAEPWRSAALAFVRGEGAPQLALLASVKAEKKEKEPRFVPAPGTPGLESPSEEALAALRARIAEQVKSAIVELDAPEFEVRSRADAALRRIGLAAQKALEEAVARGPSPEVLLRARRILAALPRRPSAGRWLIHQPDVNYPDDDVIIWQGPDRNQRAFLLSPGTEVTLLEEVQGERFGTAHVMCRIRTADGRSGWVPKRWLRHEGGREELRPLGPDETMTVEYFETVWNRAIDLFKEGFREDRSRMDFSKSLEGASQEAGFQDFQQFTLRAARDLDQGAYMESMRRMSEKLQQEMKKLVMEESGIEDGDEEDEGDEGDGEDEEGTKKD